MSPARRRLHRSDLLYPDESYQIVGVLFDVYNSLGAGHHEKYYQRAIREEFVRRGIPFREQVFQPLKFRDRIIGRQYFDFLVFGKIVLEIKKGDHFSKRHIDQVLSYLRASGLPLAILGNFGSKGITFKRIVHVHATA